MVWSNWQAAIRRGALILVLAWSGLAWTQTSTPRPDADPAERIMVVHENGKSTRCKVLETWQLPDGRVAHLPKAIDNGEMITIVDDQTPSPETMKNPRAMPKRIFAWGQGLTTPPAGSPLPPHMRIDSGVVVKNEAPAPADAVPSTGPAALNRAVDDNALGGTYHPEGPIVVQHSTVRGPTLRDRLFGRREIITTDPQVVAFQGLPKSGTNPTIVNEQPVVAENPGTPTT